jgi:hypothetical protein
VDYSTAEGFTSVSRRCHRRTLIGIVHASHGCSDATGVIHSVVMRSTHLPILCAVAFLASTAPLAAQRGESQAPRNPARAPAPAAAAEASELASGWSLLVQGQVAQAGKKAADLVAANPRSGAALSLAIEVEIARAGAGAALTMYEGWLGARRLEEPGAVRQLARATLREQSAQQQDLRARAEALRALATTGDQQAASALAKSSVSGGTVERTQAALGDERAVKELLVQLKAGASDVRTIDAIGRSGTREAIPLLLPRLKDPRAEVRGAAAEALAKIGDPQVVPQLKALLSDMSASVRIRVAGALAGMGDLSGMSLLQQLLTDPAPQMRLAGVEALAATPDAAWLGVVRELTGVPDPEIQARAARLLAPHDETAARRVLDGLAAHENPAIRELAANSLGDVVTSDLKTLRDLMQAPAPIARVRAAIRVFEVTR